MASATGAPPLPTLLVSAAAAAIVVAIWRRFSAGRATSNNVPPSLAADLWISYRLWVDAQVSDPEHGQRVVESFHEFVHARALGHETSPPSVVTGSDAATVVTRLAAAGLLCGGGARPQSSEAAQAAMRRWLAEALVAFEARRAVSRAAATGDVAALTRLLDEGAVAHPDVQLPHAEPVEAGETALHVAARAGHAAAVALLLDRRADVRACAPADGGEPIHAAAQGRSAETLALLLARGADVHARSSEQHGHTALHAAALHGRLAAVKLLVARGADVQIRTKSGTTPLDLATRHRSREWEALAAFLRRASLAEGAQPKGARLLAIRELVM